MAIEYVHSTPDGNITVKWLDTGISNEIHVANTISDLLVQDVLNACRAAEGSVQGQGFGQIAAASGKQVLGAGVNVGITLELLGTWRVYSTKNTGVFTVLGGNLVKGDGSSPFRPNNNITYVNVLSASSTIVSTEGGGGGGGDFTAGDRAIITATAEGVAAIQAALTTMNAITERLTPPGTVASLPDAIAWLISLASNLITETDTVRQLWNRAGTQVIGTWNNSDPTPGAGGTFRRESVS